MWISEIQLENVRSFETTGPIKLSKSINLFVGQNNAGKSTILRSIQLLQPTETHSAALDFFRNTSLRWHGGQAQITIEFSAADPRLLNTGPSFDLRSGKFRCFLSGIPPAYNLSATNIHNQLGGVNQQLLRPNEPDNFIYPYFSPRKPVFYQMQISQKNANSISDGNENLASKVDRIANSYFKHHAVFRDACRAILGLEVSCAQYGEGKQAGLMLDDGTLLPVNAMGDGTLNVITLLVHLCSSKGRLFLIEEIENDIYPKALRSLLDFVIEKAVDNQFLISTHSNIVLRQLGAHSATTVFSVEMEMDKSTQLPTSRCKQIENTPSARIQLLESLGYDVFDFEMWKGYLILEEATAETLIKDFFIPHFFPKLQGRLKTISAGGVTKVKSRFSSLHDLFVFLHTAPLYEGKAWVGVDGGGDGEKVVTELKSKFKTWKGEHFRCFAKPRFEDYYPSIFQSKVEDAFAIQDASKRQIAKAELVQAVLNWAKENKKEAEQEFSKSAADVIALLGEIQSRLVL